MSPGRTQSARARLAVIACALWLCGVEAMPALHEATHDRLAPHRHDAGSIVVASFEDTTHRHPDGTIHFASAKPKPARHARPHHGGRPADAPPRTSDAAHHADGLAHHAAALAPVPPPVTQPLPIDRRPTFVVAPSPIELVARDPLAASARGPPTIA